VNIQRIDGMVRVSIASGSPNDHRIRSTSPRNSVGRCRLSRSARRRSSCSVDRSATLRSRKPALASFRAKPSTACVEMRKPSLARDAAISDGGRRPSKQRITRTSVDPKRKYFCAARSFTTKLASPR
jgi:hypothetical protein